MSKLMGDTKTYGSTRAWATKSAGWLTTAGGIVHTALTFWGTREVWSQVADEGWLNTFTLTRPTSLAEFERAEAFWFSMGSFSVPTLILGAFVLWAARRGDRVPGWIGAALLVWAAAIAIVLPASPGWALLAAGVLIVIGDTRSRRRSEIVA